jgi:hypothetical protein
MLMLLTMTSRFAAPPDTGGLTQAAWQAHEVICRAFVSNAKPLRGGEAS